MAQFSTGRTYNGPQVISYTVVATDDASHWLEGSFDATVEFQDDSRGIAGSVWLPMVSNDADIQRSLMASYDAGTYKTL